DLYLLFATKRGLVKKTVLSAYGNPREKGIIAIKLDDDDELLSAQITVGTRTDVAEYRHQARGGSGVINVRVTEKNGPVVGISSVTEGDHLLVITEQGILIRLAVADVRETGRAAMGVKLIDLAEGDRVVAVAKLAERDEESENGTAGPTAPAPAA